MTYFVAWQDPNGRGWFPIGRLGREGKLFRFVYTKGAEEAADKAGFRPLESFPDFREVYRSTTLFPLFANRTLQPKRPDYDDHVRSLNVPRDTLDPLVVLARSGGLRTTDTFEVFPQPQPNEAGEYHIHFFVHGLRYFPLESLERVGRLQPQEKLLVVWDWQNPHDPMAMMLRTNDSIPRDRYLIGFCPRYLAEDVFEAFCGCREQGTFPPMTVTVERVNPPPAPLQLRLLCALTACWPEGFLPCSQPHYEPLVTDPPRAAVG